MNINNKVISMSAVLILVISLSIPNTAALVIKKDLSELTKEADSIVVGNVKEMKSYKENGLIFTDVTVSVDIRLKGNNQDNVKVKVPGGTVDGLHAEVSEAPFFEKGQNVLLFSKGKDVIGMNQGKFSINKGRIIENNESLAEFAQKIKNEIKISPKKGETGRSIGTKSAKLDKNSRVLIPANNSSSNDTFMPPVRNNALSAIKYEGFEGAFPDAWMLFGSPTWCNNTYRSAAGSWSGWPACGGSGMVEAGNLYPDNLNSWMIFGPVDLSDATDAYVTFKHYTQTEYGFDYFWVAASTSLYDYFYGTYWTGDYGLWRDEIFDLKNVPGLGDLRGQSSVFIAFIFQSDLNIQDNGTFLDEIVISKDTTPISTPHIIDITPNSGPAKASELGSYEAAADSTQVTITGTDFGAAAGNVEFWRVENIYIPATIVSWTDTQIAAKVPGGISSHIKPDGTGNVRIINSAGNPSDNFGFFRVTYSYGGGKWPGNGYTYKVNPNTNDTPDELEAVQAAANTWNNGGASFTYTYGGLSTLSTIGFDYENSIIWGADTVGILATAWYYWWLDDPHSIIETDIIFNDYYDWSTSPSGGSYDIQSIGIHELGHGLNLLDMYGSEDSPKVMYGYGGSGIIKRDLNVDDIDGIKAIYGSSITQTPSVFARGTDNAIWLRKMTGNPPDPWTSLGGIFNSNPDSVVSGSDTYVFARGTDNAIWYSKLTGNSWTPWTSLGGIFASDPEVIVSGSDTYVFARGSDNAIWYSKLTGNSWTPWASIGGIFASNPDSVVSGSDTYVFARGTDSAIWYTKLTPGLPPAPLTSLEGGLAADPESIVISGSGTYVFSRGIDNAIWNRKLDAPWTSLGGIFASEPKSVVSGSDTNLFARGTDNAIWYSKLTGTTWTPWASLGGGLASDPESVVSGPETYLFARGTDNAIWYRKLTGTTWEPWASLGGGLESNPSAVIN